MALPDYPLIVDPLRYQSQSLHFTDWITLFTLCLAPLIAHIIAGVPRTVLVNQSPPKWYQRLCHFNPTSIIWRYAIITDRWIRCVSWDRNVLAATNALFWTLKGWDGSEEMIQESFKHRIYLPENTRVEFTSSETLNTLIVTIQGGQALYIVVNGMIGNNKSSQVLSSLALDKIFFPLAVMGLLRVFCALWLTNDFAYATIETQASDSEMRPLCPGADGNSHAEDRDAGHPGQPVLGCAGAPTIRPVSWWASRVFRAVFLLVLLGLFAIPLFFITLIPWLQYEQTQYETSEFSATLFVLVLFYLFLFTATLATTSYYFIRGHTSTVLPCIQSVWYAIYSSILLALAVILFIVACIETRKAPCGNYTSTRGIHADLDACAGDLNWLIQIESGAGNNLAIARPFLSSTGPSNAESPTETMGTIVGVGEFSIFNFTGVCLGDLHER